MVIFLPMRDIRKVRQISGDPKYPVLAIPLSKEIRDVFGVKKGDRVLLEATDGRIVVTREKSK